MKKYIAGLLTGVIISLSLTTFAAVELEVIPNPYPIMVDGQEVSVDGYNINGSTYLKLADLLKIVGMSFDFSDKTIQLNTANKLDTSSSDTKGSLPDYSVPEIDDTKLYYNVTVLEDEDVEATTFGKYKAIKYDGNTYIGSIDLRKYKQISVKTEELGVQKIYQNGVLILETKNADPANYFNYGGQLYFNIRFLGKYLED